jgi:hypothetical protein
VAARTHSGVFTLDSRVDVSPPPGVISICMSSSG